MAETERGKLKVFMGYAAGVGKTYMMLEEAQASVSEDLPIDLPQGQRANPR